MKLYYEMYGVGSSKYSVSAHNGIDTHTDGSPFFGIKLFKNKKKKGEYIKSLKNEGYIEKPFNYTYKMDFKI